MTKLLLAGYFGCGNLGDDAILLGCLNAFDKAGEEFHYQVLCDSPEFLRRQYNLSGVARMDRSSVGKAIQECDALVFCGGSIFQDATSFRSVAYYADLVSRAKKAGKKVLLLSQGVGPVRGIFSKRLTAEAFRNADFVTVRDPASLTLLKSIGVHRPMKLTSDNAFLLPNPPDQDEQTQFGIAGRKTIAIMPRPLPNHLKGDSKSLAKVFAETCKLLTAKGMSVTLIEMDEKLDGPFIDLIEKTAGGRLSHIKKIGSPIKVQSRLKRMDGVISLRLHGAILAATVGIAPFILSYDPKTLALSKLLDLPNPLPLEHLTAPRIVEAFVAFQDKREYYERLVSKRTEEMSKLALENMLEVIRTFHSPATL